jgi:hypothetical protein
VANTEHIAERKVGSQRAEADPPQQRGVQPVGQQVVPEQRDDTGQAQRGGQPETPGGCWRKKKLLMALNSTAMEKITDSRPVLIQAAAV